MKIAMPIFKEEDRLLPHFGASSTFLVADIEDGRILRQTIRDMEGSNLLEICRGLSKIGLNVLICGGIDRSCRNYLIEKEIIVVDNKSGAASQLLKEFSQVLND